MSTAELQPVLNIFNEVDALQKGIIYTYLVINWKLLIKNPNLANEMVEKVNTKVNE